MSITINRLRQEDKFLELGGGEHPVVHPRCLGGPDINVDVRPCFNESGQQTIDFQVELQEFPWPIGSDEFDGLVCVFCLEHISYPLVPAFLKEALRVLKPGCKCIFALPNTEAQLKWVQTHPDGWDGKPMFESASEVLFGTQDEHTARGHQSYWSPGVATVLFTAAGFDQVRVFPYGERATDMVVEAVRPNSFNFSGWMRNAAGNPERPIQSGDGDQVPHVLIPGEWEVCSVEGPNGVRCTKPKGHAGKHAAESR